MRILDRLLDRLLVVRWKDDDHPQRMAELDRKARRSVTVQRRLERLEVQAEALRPRRTRR